MSVSRCTSEIFAGFHALMRIHDSGTMEARKQHDVLLLRDAHSAHTAGAGLHLEELY